MSGTPLCIVKLGGSHALQSHLKSWLAAIAQSCGRIVVVPGGGPFADSVRAAQKVMGFDDRAAHHMALLAMEQFGIAIAALAPAFQLTSSPEEIRAAVTDGRVPVWLPTRMALSEPSLPQTWDLTSDSLAAWLAGRLLAARLVMVKHVGHLGGTDRVDPLFARYLDASGATCTFLGPHEASALTAVLDRPA